MDKKYSSIHYHSYLDLDKILNAQQLRSVEFGKPAHDEMLFIVVHQVYELWFKEIIHDLQSVMEIFSGDEVEEKEIGIAISRLSRITKIQKILIDQIEVIETMTPLDFLDFRNYLLPASGFQSYQFRVVEVALGLKTKERVSYTEGHYANVFTEEQRAYLKQLEDGQSMFELVEKWLERIPFLKIDDFDFQTEYKTAVKNMVDEERKMILEVDYLSEKDKKFRLQMLDDNAVYFSDVFNEKLHNEKVDRGELKLSYKATLSALLINLYRDEPLLRQPYLFLQRLVDIDENFTSWRNRHAQMVLRTLGRKMGTGGSSGYEYLQKTANSHRLFIDLHNISTLLIPRSKLPVLPDELKKKLDFNYPQSHE